MFRKYLLIFIMVILCLPSVVFARESELGAQREDVIQLILKAQAETQMTYDQANAIMIDLENEVLNGKEIATSDAYLKDDVKVKQLSNLSHADEVAIIDYLMNFKANEVQPKTKDYPLAYKVNVKDMPSPAVFHLEGMNIPTEIKLDVDKKTVQFINSGNSSMTVTYKVEIKQDQARKLRIFSNDGSGKRTVYVNTVVVIKDLVKGSEGQFDKVGDLYLFYNKKGNISLVSPNYAGNVEEADQDVLLEYLIE